MRRCSRDAKWRLIYSPPPSLVKGAKGWEQVPLIDLWRTMFFCKYVVGEGLVQHGPLQPRWPPFCSRHNDSYALQLTSDSDDMPAARNR